jgi:hypothetical protein
MFAKLTSLLLGLGLLAAGVPVDQPDDAPQVIKLERGR